ncbi:hypothetical protein ACFYSH_19615 [Streptomyces sp. NPDC005791]|uniref:hypothetical protein n=1 Tax=Streptomyces sp. NPDC005791 TaxID=3364732 RepID=UPI00367F1E08
MSDDDDDWMARIIKEYDNTEDPDLRAELLMCHGIHPRALASARQRLARREKTSLTASTPEPRVRRMSRATRRPITPRRLGSPCTQLLRARHSTRKVHTTGRTVTVMTTTVTVTTVTTVTTTNS